MGQYDIKKQLENIQQILCNAISYVLWLYDNKHISLRTKEELLKRLDNRKGGE